MRSGKKIPSYIQCDQWLELLEELNIGAFTVDLDRRVMAMNYSAQALMGLRESDVVGCDCREVFWGVPCMADCLLVADGDERRRDAGVDRGGVVDSQFLVTRVATPLFDHRHRMIGCLTVLQDHSPIADLINRVQYEERSMKIVLDNLDVGIFTVNRGGLITFFNTSAEKILGYRRDEILGRRCASIFEGDGSVDVHLLMESVTDGKSRSTANARMVTTEGLALPIRATFMALRNERGRIVGGLATFHDLTLIRRLTQAVSDRYTFHDMIGKSPRMQKIFEMMAVVAKSSATILVEGATGTGKDLLASGIHSASRRSAKPLVKVNCAAIPDNLLESELFGYVKGAFTGADRDKPGRFQFADGGTIFLDEIGDLPLSLQAKLLRVLEDREFYPLGSRQTQKVDVRILAATNRELEKLVGRGQFREDLYYRLNVVQIRLPLLKERREDLPLLVSHIARKLYAEKERPPPALSEEVMEVLLNYDYPGNVRELENILEHALIICRGETIKLAHLPVSLQGVPVEGKGRPGPSGKPGDPELESERRSLAETLERFGGHRGRTARALGIDRTTLWRRMKKLGL